MELVLPLTKVSGGIRVQAKERYSENSPRKVAQTANLILRITGLKRLKPTLLYAHAAMPSDKRCRSQ